MAFKPKVRKRWTAPVPVVATEACWLESDSYDRRAWREITQSASSVQELTAAATRLVPHFDALLQDLFLALFKYNLVWLKPDAVRRTAVLNRTILARLISSTAFQALKRRTLLEEDKAAIGAIVLGEQAVEMLRSEQLVNRDEMLDLWDLAHQEDDLQSRAEALRHAEETMKRLDRQSKADEQTKANVSKLLQAAGRAASVSRARLNQKARQVETRLEHSDQKAIGHLELRSAELAGEIDRAANDSHDFGREFGQGGRLSADDRLELGRRLARNRKLGELARLVGRFKQDARALRRRKFERGSAEAHDIERGSEIDRLIPAELIVLHHPQLRRDFERRLLESSLLQYRLRENEQKGKGPMVVCVDVSSSMQGDKEMWAKAVALTLMDIARRQRRLFRAVMFSSGQAALKVLDLNRERRYQPELRKVLEMAEYFPGGGTEFERPIDAAVELVSAKALRRADIVIITDGECQVGDQWLERLKDSKRALEFSIFGILIDVGSSQLSALGRFCDQVTSLSKLSQSDARDIFLKLGG